jgi:peptidoglycan hydrolase-like protein with peptidoglycan-binding domain
MAKSITASVGRGGMNRPSDVKTIQDLLNRVGGPNGGPISTLQVDGLCGPMTIAAIQRFQLKHFGTRGADSRVDPLGQTLRKLNEFDVSADFPPITTDSVLRCPHGAEIKAVAKVGTGFTGKVALTTSDQFMINGCTMADFTGPSPCITVKWVSSPTPTLDRRSVGVCLNARQIPQGPVNVGSL